MTEPQITILDNGLRVASWALPGLETAAVALTAETGSRFEHPEHNGLAHLFEHMVFKGTQRRSARAIAEEMEDVGGQLNAWTSRDTTMFHARLLARDLPLGVDLIADLVTGARFDPDDIVREKEVVLQELGEARDTPDDIVFDHLQEAAFPEQALGRSILGDEASLARITRDDLLGWQADHYAPQRLTLVAAGKVDHAELCRFAQAAFPAAAGHNPSPAGDDVRFHPGRHHDARRIEQAQLTAGWAAPGHHDPAQDAALLFTLAAGGGMSSRLFQQVREERGLAYTVSASLQPYVDAGLMSVHAATDPKQAAAARDLIMAVLHETAASLEQAELNRARAQAVAGLLMALEGPQGASDYLGRSLIVHGRFLPPAELVARIDAVTVDAARAAGASMLSAAPARAEIGRHKAAA
ncbi:pitrilysin family protein [Sandarakinorhabdus sp. AAP62]|uniref:M16 family metallopeptidase n=1 Tax=Sandarakinorhabdus sp. AAP62 TaxID=1248916 RepID=UPI0002F47C02|nr:pitrilysin family protein [Sandarakinorhabdus sp. AAP62]